LAYRAHVLRAAATRARPLCPGRAPELRADARHPHLSRRVLRPRASPARGRRFRLPGAAPSGLQLPLARLQQEHRVIAHAGEALRAQIAAIVDGAFIPRAEVEAAAATYLVYYRSHIEHEEREILGRAAAALTDEDWKAVRAAAPHIEDPLFGAATQERFRQLRREISLES